MISYVILITVSLLHLYVVHFHWYRVLFTLQTRCDNPSYIISYPHAISIVHYNTINSTPTLYKCIKLSKMNVSQILANHIMRDQSGVYYVNKTYYVGQERGICPVIKEIQVPNVSSLPVCNRPLSVKSPREWTLSSRFLCSVPSIIINNTNSWDDYVSESLKRVNISDSNERGVYMEEPFLNTPIGAFVENVRYNTQNQTIEVFVPGATNISTQQKFSFQERMEFRTMTISIISDEPKRMPTVKLSPDSLRSDVWIDEVLILTSRFFNNIYHNMEHMNNLLHCTDSYYHCPKFQYVMVYDTHPNYHLDFSEMYNELVINTLPENYRPFLITKSIIKSLKDGIYIKRALIMSIFTPVQETFINEVEAISVMRTAYRMFNISSYITEPEHLKLVYIQRTGMRQILNEKQVLNALNKDIGLEIMVVHLEKLSAEKQVRLFSEVDIAFGVHGAGFVNCLWMMPFSGLMEIINPRYPRFYYGYMAFMKRLFYTGFRNVTMTEGTIMLAMPLELRNRHTRNLDVTLDMQSFLLFMKVMVANVISTKYKFI